MRIRSLTLTNFRLFEQPRTFNFDPQFNLLVGSNGTGKSSVVDGLAVALGVWLVNPPDTTLRNSGRDILDSEIHLKTAQRGDRVQFEQQGAAYVWASGQVGDRKEIGWKRSLSTARSETDNSGASEVLSLIDNLYKRASNESLTMPIVANYGAGRAWSPTTERKPWVPEPPQPARRWAAFDGCLSERIQSTDLREWFSRETLVAAATGGKLRPGAEAVRRAVLECLPEATDVGFDWDRSDIVAEINGTAAPFANLSAGQRMLLALISDIAIRAVTQNAHLLPEYSKEENDSDLPAVLTETPGVVLIDEIDVHLHPKWQRRIQQDLTRVFPSLQFICTSHSPFVIQSLSPGQLIALEEGFEGVEYSDKPIADIVENVQDVPMPDRSLRDEELVHATEEYFRLLQKSDAPEEQLRDAEAAYRKAREPFSDSKGLNALLKLEAMAAGRKPEI